MSDAPPQPAPKKRGPGRPKKQPGDVATPTPLWKPDLVKNKAALDKIAGAIKFDAQSEVMHAALLANPAEFARLLPRLPKYVPVITHTKQMLAMMFKGLELLYGGGKKGGKTVLAAMKALEFAEHPGYSCLVLRRNYKQLVRSQSGILTLMKRWLKPFSDVDWNEARMCFEFQSGARIDVGHMEHEEDRFDYDGSEYQRIIFDQVEQFPPECYEYMFGCLQRTDATAEIPLQIISTANPVGPFKAYYKQRFITEPSPMEKGEQQRMFIPALGIDNPFLDHESYRRSMKQLDRITRARLEGGDWDIEDSGQMFARSWFKVVDELPTLAVMATASDFAYSTDARADYTVIVEGGLDEQGRFVMIREHRGKWHMSEVEAMLQMVAAGLPPDTVHYGQQTSGAGKGEDERIKSAVMRGYNYESETVAGGRNRQKTLRAAPLASGAQRGEVLMLAGDWNEGCLQEFESFDPINMEHEHDDRVDAWGLLYRKLTGLTDFAVSSMMGGGDFDEEDLASFMSG